MFWFLDSPGRHTALQRFVFGNGNNRGLYRRGHDSSRSKRRSAKSFGMTMYPPRSSYETHDKPCTVPGPRRMEVSSAESPLMGRSAWWDLSPERDQPVSDSTGYGGTIRGRNWAYPRRSLRSARTFTAPTFVPSNSERLVVDGWFLVANFASSFFKAFNIFKVSSRFWDAYTIEGSERTRRRA
jgi:hypothetical protein